MDKWAQEVKIALIRQDVSLTDLAVRVGVSQPQMSNILAGKRQGSFGLAQQVETILRVPADLWAACRGYIPDDLTTRYGVDGITEAFQRMREDGHV